MSTPELSIILASQGEAEETARCLSSLLGQQGVSPDQLQLIVAEGPPSRACQALREQFPTVLFVEAAGTSIPLLHGAGMAMSTGKLVAITEAHCTFPPDWATSALQAHTGSDASVIGGCVLPAGELGALNCGLFFCDYAQFLPPMSNGPVSDLPGNNVVFKRSCLNDPSQFARQGFWKTFYCKTLEKQGHRLEATPAMRVFYNRRLKLNQIFTRRYNHGRCFGAMRGAQVNGARRAAYCLTGPALPALLLCKLLKRSWPKRDYRSEFIKAIPSAALSVTVWAFGEWIGNLIGAGESCQRL